MQDRAPLMTHPAHWTSDERGVSAVEFGLIAPVLMAVLMGTIEFGLMLYTYNAGGTAVRDVARRIATNRLAVASASTSVNQQLPPWAQSAATVNVSQTSPSTPATNQIKVSLSLPAMNATPTNFMSYIYASSILQTATTMQQEIAP